MILYCLSVMIGFVLAGIYIRRQPSHFEENLLRNVYAGKKVMVAVDNDGYIFELVNNKMVITQRKLEISLEKPDDVVTGWPV